MINRRRFLQTVSVGLLAAPLAGEAQQARKVYRIGFISPGSGPDALTETFRQGLREFGYVEGQNLVSEYRGTALGEPLAKLAAELVVLKPDLIVSVSHRVSMEVKRATSTIPVIFAHVNDPIGVGLPASERTAGRAEWAQRGQQRAHLRARPCEPPADNAWVSRLLDAGGLVSYGPELHVHFKRLAAYVDKVLKGARPADLPVEQPTKFELVITMKTAKALGLRIPSSILVRADQMVE